MRVLDAVGQSAATMTRRTMVVVVLVSIAAAVASLILLAWPMLSSFKCIWALVTLALIITWGFAAEFAQSR